MGDDEILERIEEAELQFIKMSMKKLYSIWNKIGMETDEKVNLVQTAWSHIQSLVQDICDEEASIFEDLKSRIKDFKKNITELSKLLAIELPKFTGLSLSETDAFLQKQFDSLMEEREKRYLKYCQYRKELAFILKETKILPESDLERQLCSEEEPPSLSDNTFQAIEKVLFEAKNKRSEFEKKKLIYEITLFRERQNAKIDTSEFIKNLHNCELSKLKHIHDDLIRCEEIKLNNLKLLGSIREELKTLWDKCGTSESERHIYLNSSTEVTEDILVAHEVEIEKWKIYYEEHKHILEKIVVRNKLWELFITLDKKANDPERFKNRGGNLLQEEKERNKMQSLPFIEKELHKTIEEYEQKTGRKFHYLGKDYKLFIFKQWQEHLKENCEKEKYFNVCIPLKRSIFSTSKSAPCSPRSKSYRSPMKASPKSAPCTPRFKSCSTPVKRPRSSTKQPVSRSKVINKKLANFKEKY